MCARSLAGDLQQGRREEATTMTLATLINSRTWRDRMAETSESAMPETDNFRHWVILDLATERILASVEAG